MQTKCHCTHCPNHPQHNTNKQPPENYNPTQTHINDPYNTGTQVQCLKPKSPAFQHYNIDPNQHTYPITAYDNNNTPTTGFTNQGITLYATCENATYQHSPTPPPHMRKIIDIKQDDKWTQFWFADGKNNPTQPDNTCKTHTLNNLLTQHNLQTHAHKHGRIGLWVNWPKDQQNPTSIHTELTNQQ